MEESAPTRSAIQWWQLTTDGSVVSRGRLDDPSGGTFYAFPSVAPNRNNDLLIGFSTFSAETFASGGYVFRAASDAPTRSSVDCPEIFLPAKRIVPLASGTPAPPAARRQRRHVAAQVVDVVVARDELRRRFPHELAQHECERRGR